MTYYQTMWKRPVVLPADEAKKERKPLSEEEYAALMHADHASRRKKARARNQKPAYFDRVMELMSDGQPRMVATMKAQLQTQDRRVRDAAVYAYRKGLFTRTEPSGTNPMAYKINPEALAAMEGSEE